MDYRDESYHEINLLLEALHYDIGEPFPLRWSLLWFAAPTNINRKFVNNGTRVRQWLKFGVQRTFLSIPSSCAHDVVVLLLIAVPLLSYRLVHPPGLHLLLP